MTDRGRRFGKGIAIALAVHIIAAALLGILGYRFTQRPPQILEVTWGGGGGGGGKGSAAAEKGTAETAAATVQQQKQQSAPVRTDDIVDRKQKPQTQQQEQPQTTAVEQYDRVKRLRVMLKAVKPVVLVPVAVKEQGLGQGRAAVKAAARVLAVVLEAAAAVGRSGKRQRCSGNTAVFSIQYGSSLSSCRQKSRDRGYCLCKNACKFGRQC